MEREKIIRGIEAFDPELFDFIQMELKTQRYTLSLLPNENYASPFCSYLKGSLLSNTYMDYHDVVTCSRLESLAIERAKRLFGSEAAIVRINNLVAASQIVFHNFVNTGDTIMSFNLRKREYCYTEDMKYNFVKYSIEPETQHLDYRHIEALAQECRPKMIIFSPTNYPKDVNYRKLAQIAHGVGAVLWVDMSAVVGLVAAKLMHSPVPHADVVTFYTHDTLRGPQSAVILTNSENVDSLNQIAINTGHVYLQENVLAALCIAFREAETPERCLRDVTPTTTGAAYLEALCETHAADEALERGAIGAAGDGAAKANAWKQIKGLWLAELDALTNARYLAADAAGRKVIAAERVSFGNWLKAREAVLELLYPDHPEIVGEVIADAIRGRVLSLCGEE